MEWFREYLCFMAVVSGEVLRMTGMDATASETMLMGPGFSFVVVRGCDGLEMIALFVAAVLAFPASRRSKIIFALSGAVSLLIVNVIRIVSLAYADTYSPGLSEQLHLDVWPGVLIIAILSCWLMWARRVIRMPGERDHASI